MIRRRTRFTRRQYFIYEFRVGATANGNAVFFSQTVSLSLTYRLRVLCKLHVAYCFIGLLERHEPPLSLTRRSPMSHVSCVTLESILRSQNPDPSREIIAVSQHHCRYRSV